MSQLTGKALVICGPSGSGKSTLIAKLLQELGEKLALCVSHTTRPARSGERNGREYHFVAKNVFDSMIANKEFVEFAQFSDNYYGTSWKSLQDVQRLNRVPILDLEMEGVRSMKNTNFVAAYVFIKPPDIKSLEQNLRKRGTETERQIHDRLKRAVDDIKLADSGLFDLVIVNKDLNIAYNQFKQFAIKFINS